MYFVYILRCRGDRLYTGITTDIERRFREHLGNPRGAKFTRANPPQEIAAFWSCENRSVASKLECAIKKLPRSKKLLLIENKLSAEDLTNGLISRNDGVIYDNVQNNTNFA